MTDPQINQRRESDQADDDQPRLTRMVDMRMPMHWMLGVAGGVGWALVSMYFAVGQLVTQMTELQIAVKSGNGSVTAIAGKQALIEFRMENVENTLKKNEASLLILQQKGLK